MAGCVLAARLTAAGRRVLLIEAGPVHPSEADLPADVADASEPRLGHDWGFAAEPDGERAPVPLPRARLLGDQRDVLRARLAGRLRRLGRCRQRRVVVRRAVAVLPGGESDDDGDEWHGGEGPIPVVRTPRDALEPWPRAFLDAAVAAGHPPVADQTALAPRASAR